MFERSDFDKATYNDLMYAIKEINKQREELKESYYYKLGKKTKYFLDYFHLRTLKSKLERRFKYGKINVAKDLTTAINERKNCLYFSTERIAVYTAVSGKYDNITEPLYIPDNCDFYAITDFEIAEDSKWNRIDMNSFQEIKGLDNISKNRYFKFFPHKIFKNYRYSIYIDGNFTIVSDLTEHINRISKIGLSMFIHSKRTCVYDEIKTCITLKKESKQKLERYREYLESNNFPHDYGLLECGIIVRDHYSEICRRIMQEWWDIFVEFIHRDQVILPYVLFKNSIKVEEVGTLGRNVHKD